MTTIVKEYPILFKGRLVRAILEGRKTQTRRVIKPQPPEWAVAFQDCHPDGFFWNDTNQDDDMALWYPEYESEGVRCPFGQPYDRIWVRENLRWEEGRLVYDADNEPIDPEKIPETATPVSRKVLPSIFMPKWARRLTLEIKSIRVERIQDISEEDAIAEGATKTGNYWDGATHKIKGTPLAMPTARAAFLSTWDTINAERGFGWETNPWVWVVEFERIKNG